MSGYTVTREHEICCGHRVYGHEGKCKNLHGHNYKFELTIAPKNELDMLGRVIDFSLIKSLLCEWLEKEWDHKMLLWNKDPMSNYLVNATYALVEGDTHWVVRLPCNPTVENLAQYFVEDIAPGLLLEHDVVLRSVRIWETSKCSAEYVRKDYDTTIRNIANKGVSERVGPE